MDFVLNCFYDLSVSPAYFDFFTFLQSAELHRIRHGFQKIRFLFVKGPRDGFRQDNLRTTESNQLMFRNVLLPSCHLLESVTEILWVSSRAECRQYLANSKNIFPRGYSMERPVPDYLEGAIQCAFLRGETISRFRAPAEKRAAAESFIASVSGGKKIITLTLREAAHDSSDRRALDESEWTRFLKSPEGSAYQPVIVRDTCKMFSTDGVFPMFPHVPLASADVLFRTALYESAHINIFPNNGPYMCSLYGKSVSLAFKYQDDRVPATSAKWFDEMLGIAFGEQRPISDKRTMIVWEDDRVDVITRSIAHMESLLAQGAALDEKHGMTSVEQVRRTINVALKYTIGKLRGLADVEDVAVLAQIQKLCDIFEFRFGSNQQLRELLLNGEGRLFEPGTLQKLRELEKGAATGLCL